MDPEVRPSGPSSHPVDGASCGTSFDKGQRHCSEAMSNFGADGYLRKPLDPELLATTWQGLVRIPGDP